MGFPLTAAQLEAGVTDLRALIVSTLSYDASSVVDGRRPTTSRKSPWAWIRRMPGESRMQLAGGIRRMYAYRVALYRRTGDVQQEAALDVALQSDAEGLTDAIWGSSAAIWTTMTGVEAAEAELTARDSEETLEGEQVAVVDVKVQCYEA